MVQSEFTVELSDGKTYVLTVTLEAMQKINRAFDSYVNAVKQVQELNFDALCAIIAAGAGLGQRQAAALQAEVFKAGIQNVAPQLGPFMVRLMDPSGGEEEGAESGKS